MSSPPAHVAVCQRLRASCGTAGFDLLHPLRVGRYNDAVDAAYRVPDFGSADSLAVIVGNTRALWPRFRDAVRGDAELAAARDPLDRYTERAIGAAVASLDMPCELRFAHEPPPRRVAMQRLTQVSGMAYLSSSSLCVHPIYGPWIALRAVLVLDLEGPEPTPPLPPPCDCRENQCEPLYQAALAASQTYARGSDAVREQWRSWVAARDACPIGRAYRYSEEQLRYHYTKDRTALDSNR